MDIPVCTTDCDCDGARYCTACNGIECSDCTDNMVCKHNPELKVCKGTARS